MPAPTIKTWTREEFERLVDLGLIGPDNRAELVDGLIVTKMRRNPPHFTALARADDFLRSIAGPDRHVRSQGPIALSDMSEPEPDLAVVKGLRKDYEKRHPGPQEVELLVEISHSSIDHDRRIKAPLYALAGIRELWIVDIDALRLEIHRDPSPTGFQTVTIHPAEETASPLFSPDAQIMVADLLPTSD